MKQLKTIILGLFFISLCSSPLFPQNSFHPFSPEDRVAKMTEELNLTPEQAEQVKAIQEKYTSKRQEIFQNMKEAHQQNFEEMKALREAQKAELQQVLSEEQMSKLQENRRKRGLHRRFQHHKHRPHFDQNREGRANNRKELRQEIRSYVLENVIPVLKSQRLKLDSELSGSDKATIEELRNRLQASKPQLQQARKDFREALMQGKKPTEELTQMNALREAHRADIEEARSLADKYRSQIEDLKTEIEGDRQQWREDIRAIAKEHFEGSDVPIGRFHHHRLRHRPHPRFFPTSFDVTYWIPTTRPQ